VSARIAAPATRVAAIRAQPNGPDTNRATTPATIATLPHRSTNASQDRNGADTVSQAFSYQALFLIPDPSSAASISSAHRLAASLRRAAASSARRRAVDQAAGGLLIRGGAHGPGHRNPDLNLDAGTLVDPDGGGVGLRNRDSPAQSRDPDRAGPPRQGLPERHQCIRLPSGTGEPVERLTTPLQGHPRLGPRLIQ
jgi:hypothetical protein